jgi:hypothetical protein
MVRSWTNKLLPVRVLAKVAITIAYGVLAIKRRFYVTCTEGLNPSYGACTTNLGIR